MKTTFSKDANGVAFVMFQPELPIESYEFTAFAKKGIEGGVEIKVHKDGDKENVVIVLKEKKEEKKDAPKKEEPKKPI